MRRPELGNTGAFGRAACCGIAATKDIWPAHELSPRANASCDDEPQHFRPVWRVARSAQQIDAEPVLLAAARIAAVPRRFKWTAVANINMLTLGCGEL